MKNSIRILLYSFWIGVVIFTLFLACSHEETIQRKDGRKTAQSRQTKEQPEPRIKVVESIEHDCGCNDNHATFHRYQILEIDGHQYLANSGGGIVHLESCQCKKQTNQ
jgi:hypothetical protein